MSRSIKASLDALLARVKIESDLQAKADAKQRLAELKNHYAKELQKLSALNKQSEDLSEELQQGGLSMWGSEPDLTSDQKERILEALAAKRKRLQDMRDNIIIRLALADDEEKAFMLRYFFHEVAKDFPNLKGLVDKMANNKKTP